MGHGFALISDSWIGIKEKRSAERKGRNDLPKSSYEDSRKKEIGEMKQYSE